MLVEVYQICLTSATQFLHAQTDGADRQTARSAANMGSALLTAWTGGFHLMGGCIVATF